jgi:hypothetical protein
MVVGVTPMPRKVFGRWRAREGTTGISGLGTDAYLPAVPKDDVEVWKNGLAVSIQFSFASPTVKTLIGVAQLAVKRA